MEVLAISNKGLLINNEIQDKEVRLIDVDGEQVGVVPIAQARKLAEDRDLDLVQVAPQANPPVCRVMDYGKHLYEQAQREKEARRNQKVVETKEVRLSVKIDTHDFNTKMNQAERFLKAGNKVKVTIRFRGREMAHPEIGRDNMIRFAEGLEEFGEVASVPKLEGRSMQMMINPTN